MVLVLILMFIAAASDFLTRQNTISRHPSRGVHAAGRTLHSSS